MLNFDLNGTFTLANFTTGQSANHPLDISQVIVTRFSADGSHFAASSGLGYARIWDAQSFQPIATVEMCIRDSHKSRLDRQHDIAARRVAEAIGYQDGISCRVGGNDID